MEEKNLPAEYPKLKAQDCADLARGMPSKRKASAAERIDYLRANGMSLDYVMEIPEGAENIVVNGILNDIARAAQVQVGHLAKYSPRTENLTFYLQYNATKGILPDLQQAGYDKFISPLNKDYSATTWGLVEAAKRQGEAGLNWHAHSWGSIVTRNALNVLAKDGYQNEELKVAAYGPAVMPGALVKPIKKIVGEKKYYELLMDSRDEDHKQNNITPALSFYSNPFDPVSAWVGFNWWPVSPYVYSGSSEYLPGASRAKLLPSFFSFFAMRSTVNPHSCYGLNCTGSRYNWTLEDSERHREFLFYPIQWLIEHRYPNGRPTP